MTDKEIAMQITLKAIECRVIKFSDKVAQSGKTFKESNEIANDDNANSIAKFYSTIYKAVESSN